MIATRRAGVLAAVLAAWPGAAWADGPPGRRASVLAEAYGGAFSLPGDQGGVIVGIDALVRYGYAQGGFAREGTIFLRHLRSVAVPVAVMAGGAYYDMEPLGFDLLLVGGSRNHWGVGGTRGLILPTGDPGAEGTMPYVGVRTGGLVRVGGRVRFVAGLWLMANTDIGRREVTYEWTDYGPLGGPPQGHYVSRATIGQFDCGVALRLGVELNL